MTKQELALEVIERLKKEYPDADCTLDYDNAWKLLVSVRLAAQCTDARVNVVVQDLYAKFPTVEALANANVADIEGYLYVIFLSFIFLRELREAEFRVQCPPPCSNCSLFLSSFSDFCYLPGHSRHCSHHKNTNSCHEQNKRQFSS